MPRELTPLEIDTIAREVVAKSLRESISACDAEENSILNDLIEEHELTDEQSVSVIEEVFAEAKEIAEKIATVLGDGPVTFGAQYDIAGSAESDFQPERAARYWAQRHNNRTSSIGRPAEVRRMMAGAYQVQDNYADYEAGPSAEW